ncbi:MAG TPA: hypothetical protein PLD88_11610 [Candidatus Berkiella sp.]|nr:hypothetical protein [Candidatus Berkiella sp.]
MLAYVLIFDQPVSSWHSFFAACKHSVSLKSFRQLLRNGAKIDAQNIIGTTPLASLALSKFPGLAKFLAIVTTELEIAGRFDFLMEAFCAAQFTSNPENLIEQIQTYPLEQQINLIKIIEQQYSNAMILKKSCLLLRDLLLPNLNDDLTVTSSTLLLSGEQPVTNASAAVGLNNDIALTAVPRSPKLS